MITYKWRMAGDTAPTPTPTPIASCTAPHHTTPPTYEKDDAEKSIHKFIVASTVPQQQHIVLILWRAQMHSQQLCHKFTHLGDILNKLTRAFFSFFSSFALLLHDVWKKKFENLHKIAITFHENDDARAKRLRYSFYMNWNFVIDL